MRPFEVDDISPIDMERVQQLTADFMKADNRGRTEAEQFLAQELHTLLKPYNKFSISLLLKRVETTIGCHVCAFFHECNHACRYQHGGYSWHQEKLAWKPLDLRYTGVRSCYACEETPDSPGWATGAAPDFSAGSSAETSPARTPGAGNSPRNSPRRNSPRSIMPRPNPTAAVLPSVQLAHAAPDQPFTQIPVVDFGEFLHGSSSQQREVAAQIGDACRNVGFMYLVNHGVPQSLIDDMFAISQQFFDLPLEEKRKVAYLPGHYRGYFGVRAEDLDQYGTGNQKKKGDLKEGFDAGLEAGRLPFGCQGSPTYHAPNRWPTKALPELQVIMNRYLDTLRSLAERLSEAFALSLGLPQHYFQRFISAPCINMRVNHYPPRPNDEEGVGCGAHSDYGLFTILAQDLVGGLQVRNSAGDYVAATPLEGSFVINIGDMMQRWTNNIYSSTVHRVVATSGCSTSRFSIPFFFNANREAIIECLPTCVSAERPALFEPDTAENILQDRYSQAFNKK